LITTPPAAASTRLPGAAVIGQQPRHVAQQQGRGRAGLGLGLQLQAQRLERLVHAQGGHEVVGQVPLVGQGETARVDPGVEGHLASPEQPAEKPGRIALDEITTGLVVVIHGQRLYRRWQLLSTASPVAIRKIGVRKIGKSASVRFPARSGGRKTGGQKRDTDHLKD
jgi:hypothetical protein